MSNLMLFFEELVPFPQKEIAESTLATSCKCTY